MKPRRAAHSTLIFSLLLSLTPATLFAQPAYKKQYTFSVNTFTARIPSWTTHLSGLKGKPGINYLEIGTFEGRSALWMVENIFTHPTSKLTIIDAFLENNYKRFLANIALSGEASRFHILSGFSTQKIRDVPFNSIDVAYIDGSGKGIVMLADIVNTWNVVKVGGVIIISRYALTPELRRAAGIRPGEPGPHEAIDAFLKLYNPFLTLMEFQPNQVFVRKRRSAE
ncbi:MAG: class I SAM-dependent methyltransferase [Hyphomicrobiaceae bacterium]